VICVPIGVLTSIYLEEFASDNWLTQIIEVNINNLAAIPSILFGVLGLATLINFFGMPRASVLVGGATLALMTLPIIIISSRAALRAVPDSIRMAGFAMGATRWQVVTHHVLPASISGILTGAIIGIAQAMGETAPLIIVGLVAFVPDPPLNPLDASTVMPAQIFSWWEMPQRAFEERAALAILLLLVVLFALNAVALVIRTRSEKRW
jgi:phosphate transport system permease protein